MSSLVESSVRKVLARRPLPHIATGNVISAVPVIYSRPWSHDHCPLTQLVELTACFRLIGQYELSPSPARWLYIIVAKQCCVHDATELVCVCVCVRVCDYTS